MATIVPIGCYNSFGGTGGAWQFNQRVITTRPGLIPQLSLAKRQISIMDKSIAVLTAVPSLASTLAYANSGSRDAGYSSGYKFGTYIGQFVDSFGPYLGLLAVAVVVWCIRSRRRKAASLPDGDV